MPAFILDLDGTLLPSHAVDNDCYWRAVGEVFGTDGASRSLHGFRHVTDEGILHEWALRTIGREASPEERSAVRGLFLDLLVAAFERQPADFEPMPGLCDWLDERSREGCGLAIATGGWSHSAAFKLAVSGLERWNLPLASADDGMARTDIMRAARRRIGKPAVADLTYVGDSPWDVSSAAALGWDFIGIASGARRQALRNAGARTVVADFAALLAE